MYQGPAYSRPSSGWPTVAIRSLLGVHPVILSCAGDHRRSAGAAGGLGEHDADQDDARRRPAARPPGPRRATANATTDAATGSTIPTSPTWAARGAAAPRRSARTARPCPAGSATAPAPTSAGGASGEAAEQRHVATRAGRTGTATTAGPRPRTGWRTRRPGRSARRGSRPTGRCARRARKYTASDERGAERRRARRAGRACRPGQTCGDQRQPDHARARAPPRPGAAPARAGRTGPTARRTPAR